MLKEFRDFAMRGNVIDLAVGVIIGAAFGAIVSSLVADIIMPPIGVALGGVDFSDFFINLSGQHFGTLADAKKAGAATINYGIFINTVVAFIIVAFVVFLIAKALIKPAPPERECPYCAMTIPKAATRCPLCTSQLAASA